MHSAVFAEKLMKRSGIEYYQATLENQYWRGHPVGVHVHTNFGSVRRVGRDYLLHRRAETSVAREMADRTGVGERMPRRRGDQCRRFVRVATVEWWR